MFATKPSDPKVQCCVKAAEEWRVAIGVAEGLLTSISGRDWQESARENFASVANKYKALAAVDRQQPWNTMLVAGSLPVIGQPRPVSVNV